MGSLLRDTKELEPALRRLVYYGVTSFLVFTTITSYDDAIATLEALPSTKEARLRRGVETFLFYLPAVVIVLTFLADVLSVYAFKAVFSYPHNPLGFGDLSAEQKTRFIFMEAIAATIAVPTFFLCRKIIHFEKATASVLREYLRLLTGSL
jgi:hypothetical protein